MPFYPALPEYKPAMVSPFEHLATGLRTGEEIMAAPVRTGLQREALQRSQMERAASAKYAQTGDVKDIMPALPPAQAAMMQGQMQAQQLELGLKAADYFDSQKFNMTWESYPKIRQDAIKQFGTFAEQNLPAPEAIGSRENFDKWKVAKLQAIAQFRAMPQTIAAQSRLEAARIAADARLRAAGVGAESRLGVAQIGAASREKVATTKGGGSPGTPRTREMMRSFRAAVDRGDYGPDEYDKWERDYKAEVAKATQAAREETPGGVAGVRSKEAGAKKAETDAAIKERFAGKLLGAKPTPIAKRTKPDGTIEYKVKMPDGKEKIMSEKELRDAGVK